MNFDKLRLEQDASLCGVNCRTVTRNCIVNSNIIVSTIAVMFVLSLYVWAIAAWDDFCAFAVTYLVDKSRYDAGGRVEAFISRFM